MLFSDHLDAFGYYISNEGIRPLKSPIEAMNAIKSPQTRKQVEHRSVS